MALFLRPSDQIAAIINYFIVLIYIIFACIANVLYLKRRDTLVKDAYEKEVISKRGKNIATGGGANAVMGTGIDDKTGGTSSRRNRRKHRNPNSRGARHQQYAQNSHLQSVSPSSARRVVSGMSTLSNAAGEHNNTIVASNSSMSRRHQPRSVSGYQTSSSTRNHGGVTQSVPSASYTTSGSSMARHPVPGSLQHGASLPPRSYQATTSIINSSNPYSVSSHHHQDRELQPADVRASGGKQGRSSMGSTTAIPPALPPAYNNNNNTSSTIDTPSGSVPLFLEPNRPLGGGGGVKRKDSLLKSPHEAAAAAAATGLVDSNASFGEEERFDNNIRESAEGPNGDSQSHYSEEEEVSQRNLHKLQRSQKQTRKHRSDRAAGGARATAVSREDDGSSSEGRSSGYYDSDYGGGKGHQSGGGGGGGESGIDDDPELRWSIAATNRSSMAAVPGVDPSFAVDSTIFIKDRICRFFIFVVVFLLARAVSTLGQLLAMYNLELKHADAYFAISSWMYYCLPLVLLHIFSTVMERVDPSRVTRVMRYGVIVMFWTMTVTFFAAIILVNTVEDTIDQYWGVVVNIIYVVWYAFVGRYIPTRLRSYGAVLEPVANRIRNTSILFSVTFFLRIIFDLPPLQNYYIDQVGNFWIITIYLPFDLVPTGLTLLFLHSRESAAVTEDGNIESSLTANGTSLSNPSMPLLNTNNVNDGANDSSY